VEGLKSIKQHIHTSGTIKFASTVLLLATAFLTDLRTRNGLRKEDYSSSGQGIRKTALQTEEKEHIGSGYLNFIQMLNQQEHNS